MSSSIDADAVRRLHFFQELSAPEATVAARELTPLQLPAKSVIFHQGDEGAWIYLLVEGEAEICVALPDGTETTLCALHAPALLGEMSLLLDEPRTATAIARRDVQVWQVSRRSFEASVRRGEGWANQLLLVMSKILACRLADMNRKLVSLLAEQNQKHAVAVPVDEIEDLRHRVFAQEFPDA